jgi:hypothetical protein
MSQGNQIAERVAKIQSAIVLTGGYPSSAIAKAEPYPPSDVSSAVCPFFINEIDGTGTSFLATGGLQFVDTDIRMHLCLSRREANMNLRDSINVALTWRDVVFEAFAKHLRLSDTPSGVQDLTFIIDASITNWSLEEYQYGTTSFVGLMFNLKVREAFPLTIAG